MRETFVAFDLETSGKYPLGSEICEIAGVKWLDGKVVDRFSSLVKTVNPMDDKVIAIHGITNEMIKDAPALGAVVKDFSKFLGEAIVMAHNAPFDMGFLAAEFELLGLPLPKSPGICTSLLAQAVVKGSANFRLGTLAQFFSIPVKHAHRALEDSEVCLKVGLKCFEIVAETSPEDVLKGVFEKQGGPLMWEQFSIKSLLENKDVKDLVEASRKRLVVEFTYSAGSRPGEVRRVTALGIVRNPRGDWLAALCHRENIEKRFYLQKISNSKILD